MKRILSFTLAVIMTAMLASCSRQNAGINGTDNAKKGELL